MPLNCHFWALINIWWCLFITVKNREQYLLLTHAQIRSKHTEPYLRAEYLSCQEEYCSLRGKNTVKPFKLILQIF